MDLFESYGEIDDSRIEKKSDYVDELLSKMKREDEKAKKTKRYKSKWARGKKKAKEPRKVVWDLLEILHSVKGLLKIHGIPRNTQIELAVIGDHIHGAAAFEDIGTWKQPRILLDRTLYDLCEPHELLDVYYGSGLHEASHINHTRKLFVRLKEGRVKGVHSIFEGLYEDERIEEKVRQESPGYAPYIHAMKRTIFERKEFGQAKDNFNELPDLDKVMAIVFGLIRCPHTITREMIEFRTVKGTDVFNRFRDLMDRMPETEDDVIRLSEKTFELFTEIKKEYEVPKEDVEEIAKEIAREKVESGEIGGKGGEEESGEGSGGESTETADEKGSSKGEVGDGDSFGKVDSKGEKESRTTKHSRGSKEEIESGDIGDDSEDRERSRFEDDSFSGSESVDSTEACESATETDIEESEEFKDYVDSISDRLTEVLESIIEDETLKIDIESIDKEIKSRKSELDKLSSTEEISEALKEGKEAELKEIGKLIEKRKEKIDRLFKKREGRRFGVPDLERMDDRLSKITGELDVEESKELAKTTEEKIEFSTPDSRAGMTRRSVVIHPKPDGECANRYNNARKFVSGHIKRMRDVFQLRLGTRKYVRRELPEGKLDKRRLAHGVTSGRIFKNSYTKEDKGIAICLLLDESGSMGISTSSRSKAGIALQISVLIAEALKGVPGIELEIYSYASCGDTDEDNLVKYLYGKRQSDLRSIGGYYHGAQNYDHMAITEAGRLFKANTVNKNRLMIVLSDGAPCGYMYGGRRAMDLTKESVRKLEKEMSVLQVAIESFDSAAMFTHYLKFLDLDDLINKMRNLIVRIIKRTTEAS